MSFAQEPSMKFSLFSGSAPDFSPLELARILKAQGWDGVEWWLIDQKPADQPGFWAGNRGTFSLAKLPERYHRVREATEGQGLAHSGLFSGVSVSDRENLAIVAKAAQALGASRVRVAIPKTAQGPDYAALFAETRNDLKFVEKLFADHGVQALIQIHHGNIVSTPSAAIRLVDGFDPKAIGIIHDLGNMSVEGREGLGTYTPGMQILGPYFAHAHVKNIVWKPSEPEADGTVNWVWSWAPLATGVGDVKGYFRSLKEVGYDGWVTIENFTLDLPLDTRLAGDLAYIRAAAEAAGC
jgi:sugar phosphate isomerase/epimerase